MERQAARRCKEGRRFWEDSAQVAEKEGEDGCQDVKAYSGRMARWAPEEAARRIWDSALERLWVGESGWGRGPGGAGYWEFIVFTIRAVSWLLVSFFWGGRQGVREEG